MNIIKASGKKEKFNREKLYQSLERVVGVQPKLAEKVCRKIAKTIYPGIDTEKILDQTIRYLREENPILAVRYNLKNAIMELGPTGFPFEKFIGEIFKEYGYFVKVGETVKGYCVNQEIDVIAQKEGKHFMIECKYHNKRGLKTDLKVAMYTWARFLDIKKMWEKTPGHQDFFHRAWLATNTKCTEEAIRYARCQGLKIISWHYPRDESLESLIEKKRLYPITILPSLSNYAKERLAEKEIILAKDLLKYSVKDLVQQIQIQPNVAQKLKGEIEKLCLT